jgi:diguanylate cyclase (GGDEF)-like protein
MDDRPTDPDARILVVDDDRFHRELARDALCERARVETCSDAREALEALARESADLVLSDLTMPGLSGLELLAEVQLRFPGTDFILLTADASVESAVEALRKGATDYLQKPVGETELVLAFERTLARRRVLAENLSLRDDLALYESCRLLTACLESEEVHSLALDLILRAVGLEQGFALYRRPGLPGADGVHVRGLSESVEAQLRGDLRARKVLGLDDVAGIQRLDRGPLHDTLRETGMEVAEIIAVSVVGEETEGGLLCMLPGPEPLAPDSLARAEIVASQASVALQNAERYRRARERAFIDDTTELYNARYLLEALDREIRRAERYGSELCVLFLDLDRFKLVNDHHGHLVGSDVLRQLSQLLLQCVRQVDTVARYGGDEFTVVLVDADEALGMTIAERIRRSVEAERFEGGVDGHLSLTASLGVANYPAHGRTREALLAAADQAMYRAKSNGRNKVSSASELG